MDFLGNGSVFRPQHGQKPESESNATLHVLQMYRLWGFMGFVSWRLVGILVIDSFAFPKNHTCRRYRARLIRQTSGNHLFGAYLIQL